MTDEPIFLGWMSFDPIEDVPLPGMPPEPASPPVPEKVRVTRRSTPRLCSDCVADIHARGVAVAPPPMPQRWHYSKGALSLYLCEGHKNQRLETP